MIQAIIIIGIVAFDQLTKYLAVTSLSQVPGQSVPFIPGFMNFTYVENTGAAFGMFGNATWLLAVISSVLAIGVIVIMVKFREIKAKLFQLSLCFIAGGAIGNIIDRIFRGYVVDMLEFDFVNFYIFNVADAFVTIGAVMLGIFIIWFWDKHKKEQKNESPKE